MKKGMSDERKNNLCNFSNNAIYYRDEWDKAMFSSKKYFPHEKRMPRRLSYFLRPITNLHS